MSNKQQIKKYLNDEFLKNECNRLTHKMIEGGMKIDRVCYFIKFYQQEYIELKEKFNFELPFETFIYGYKKVHDKKFKNL